MNRPRWIPAAGLLFDPRGLWVGAFWTTGTTFRLGMDGSEKATRYLHVYLCAIPTIQVRLTWLCPVDPAAEQARYIGKAVRP